MVPLMRLYSGSSRQFVEDTYQNRIAEKIKESFLRQLGHSPPHSEVNAWENSLRAMAMVFQHADLMNHGVIVEYQLPLSSKRLDCMICGRDDEEKDNAVIIELKKWGSCMEADVELDVLRKVEESRYRPNKKLMDHVANVIEGIPDYVLLDDQLIVYDRVMSLARRGFDDARKVVLIVQGGPGTGKSVIAINLMADLLRNGYNAQYATGSRAFTETLRKIIGPRGGVQFKYFNNYGDADYNAVDVLIADESHRIRQTSSGRYTRRERRSKVPQVEELIRASKV